MTWVALAIGGSALIGAGASYAGSKKQSDAAKDAAGLNMDQFRLLNQQQQPFMQGGYGAMGRLNTLLGLNPRPAQSFQGPQGMQGLSPELQRILGGTPSGRQSGRLQDLIAQIVSQGQQGTPQSNPGFMPTPGGGVQPIMQLGAPGAAPAGDRRMFAHSGGSRLNELLMVRAANGDRQAQAMLRGGV